jgi:hypothetical protein
MASHREINQRESNNPSKQQKSFHGFSLTLTF